MKSNRGNVFIAALIFVALALTTAGGLYLLQTRPSQPPTASITQEPATAEVSPKLPAAEEPTATASPTPTTTDETANWKTYTDNKFNVSFRYPADLTMNEPISDFGIYTVHLTRGTEWLSLNVESGKVFNSIEDFVKNRYEAPLHTYRETQAVIIGDISWFVLRGTFAGMRTLPFNQTVTLKNGVAYSLGFGSDDPSKIAENNLTLTKILATFKFLD